MSAPEAGEGSFIVFLKNNYRTHGGVYRHRAGHRGLKDSILIRLAHGVDAQNVQNRQAKTQEVAELSGNFC
jgi:hypothetical protein